MHAKHSMFRWFRVRAKQTEMKTHPRPHVMSADDACKDEYPTQNYKQAGKQVTWKDIGKRTADREPKNFRLYNYQTSYDVGV